jgi:hypothetical protein
MLSVSILLAMAAAPVSFSQPAQPAGKLIPALGTQIGQKLAVAPQVADEILLLDVKDAEPEALLKQIAKVTWGTWTTLPDGTRQLSADTGLRAKMKAEEAAKRKKEAAVAITKWFQGADTEGDGREVNQRILRQIIQGFRLNFFINFPAGRVVYSTSPTPMQKPLNGFRPEWVQAALATHNAGVDEQNKERPEDNEEMKEMMAKLTPEQKEMMLKMMERFKPKKLDTEGVRKAFIVVQRTEAMLSVSYKLLMNDGKAEDIANSEAYLGDVAAEGLTPGIEMDDEGNQKPKPPRPNATKFEPSKLSIEAYQLPNKQGFGMPGMPIKAPQVSAELTAKLVGPESVDLTEILNGEYMRAIGAQKKANLVANVSDTLFPLLPSQRTVEDLREQYEGEYTFDESTSGWMAVNTTNGPRARTNRENLKALMTQFREKTRLTLDEQARIALLTEDFPGREGMIASVGMAYGGVPRYIGDEDILRFYGRLSPSQKQTAKKGLEISYAALHAKQKDLAFKLSFGDYPMLIKPDRLGKTTSIFGAGFDPDNLDEIFTGNIEMMGGQMEPTEVIPNGIANSVVRINLIEEAALRMASPGSPESAMTLSMQEAAMAIGMTSQMNLPEVQAQMPTMATPTTRVRWQFSFLFSPQAAAERQLADDRDDPNAKAVPIKDLGPEFQGMVKKYSEQMKKISWMFQFGMLGGRQTVPPQR